MIAMAVVKGAAALFDRGAVGESLDGHRVDAGDVAGIEPAVAPVDVAGRSLEVVESG